MNMLVNFFRIISTLEGISLILLFFVAMPMKYMFGNDILISPVGMAHGILFTLYVFITIIVTFELKWDAKTVIIVLLCSLIPFGTFYMEKKYLNKNKIAAAKALK